MPSKFRKECPAPYIVEQVFSDTMCSVKDPKQPGMPSYMVHFTKPKPVTQGTILPSSSWIVTNTEPLEPTMHIETPTEGGTSEKTTHL
ncbi:hypothetical protein AHF37_05856 [Paragonimus kellicotti]|nr:hypothetical protein AHF37_05856 [Paragonimus kellicotti]